MKMQLFTQETLNILKRKADSADWQTLLARVDAWCADAVTLPNQSGGWIHNYICPTHWLPLIYDGDMPNVHRCPAGDTCTGAKYDEAWLAWRHRQIADMSREVALAYVVTGDAGYLAEVERVLLHYAAFYAGSAGADSAETWMVKGRVFNQALTEALWAMPLLHAYALVVDDLSWNVKQQIAHDFFYPLAETMTAAQDSLIANDHVESNYMAWFNAVLGCLGYLLNECALVERAIDGEGGFVRHLSVGVLADGMQYEVTPYYHNFVVLAYQYLAEAALTNGRDLYAVRGEKGQSIQSMWRALTMLTLPDGTIADLGDGSYWIDSIYDTELISVYEIAQTYDDAPAVAITLQNAYARNKSGRDNWAALLFGKNESSDEGMFQELQFPKHTATVRTLPESGVAILEASPKLVAVAPFGAYRGSHSHADQLSLQVWPFSNDAGCVLYGSKARREWYQSAYAHNGLVIDEKSHEPFGQARHNIEEKQIELWSADFSRVVRIESEQLVDELTVSAENSHQYDWLFHIDGQLTLENLEAHGHNETVGDFIEVFERVEGVESADLQGGAAHFTVIHNSQTYKLHLTTEKPFDLLLGTAPGNSWNPTDRRRVIIGRTIGTSQTYRMTISHD